ncbi:2-C-methyl-D-erythritol 4-phosphate cytidylyltransferase [Herbaspirillum sp. RV1423]|uniref:2-C-methyl-D-erythritol 4-phosphate cytidylyltransferase n=1 Tax=Herbaspirillum sp. RV1423 TaxID=1443993 RepID=UPI0004AD1470|nr:2-C-methyl-D-erythritol 4-phosphate cytidylyltransferase [Herbaspirillum sp. RV1423]
MTASASSRLARHFALIPAAGVGARLGGDIPKQYMPLAGKPMLQYALDTFAASDAIAHIFLVVSVNDGYVDDFLAAQPQLAGKLTVLRNGGATRQDSVLNGLQAIRAQVGDDDWVLVHDAARPGLNAELLNKLIAALRDDTVGGLLALPVVDTLKRSSADIAQRVQATVPREALWAAQTPQMFRYALLTGALEQAHAQNRVGDITDDASAIEMLGLQPKLVEGSPRNIKVTLAHDVALAELFLKT